MFMDRLFEASWTERVHVLRALLRLLPDLSRDLHDRLQGLLVRLLNLDQPPSLEVRPRPAPPRPPRPPRPAPPPPAPTHSAGCAQDPPQKEFVMLALQLLLACSLQSREVVLELLSYFLYSPASCR